MPDQPDFDLRRTEGPNEPIESTPPRRPTGPLVAIGVLIFAVGLAIYFLFGRGTSAPVDNTVATPPPAQAADEPVKPLGGDADAVTLPPLDDSDSVVRELVGKLSSHPRVAAWLATDGLIRNFTAVVVNISEGKTPAAHLQAVRPSPGFRVVEQDGDLLIDPRSYERYDRLADAVASIDTAGSARLYATLKPRIEEAHRDLGTPDGSFDRTLTRAIVSLLNTPVPAPSTRFARSGQAESSLPIEPRGIVYGYADPKLESLTAAQKHLLRMGPRNARLIQRKLREIALELGIPAQQLPAQR
jgi:Protein of unknown function (DUF3014)